MIKAMCGADCENCGIGKSGECVGCIESNGCPFGKKCFIAECIKERGFEEYKQFKNKLIEEFNELKVSGMPKINDLFALKGSFVNLSYPLPNGERVKLLDDNEIYLGNQVECELNDQNDKKCFGLVAGMDFLLVSKYGANGVEAEIVVFKKR